MPHPLAALVPVPRRRLATAATVAALALVTAACGSTVQVDGVAGTPIDGSLGQPGASAPLGTTGGALVGEDGALPGGSAVGSDTGSGGTAADVPGVGGAAAPGAGPSTVAGGPAATGSLKVGVLYLEGVDKMASAIGLSGLSAGDTKAQATALAAHLNAAGGVAGRKVELHFAGMDSNEFASNRDAALEAACSQLTTDDHVSFVISFLQVTPGLVSCLTKGGAALIDDATTLPDAVMNQYAGTLAAPGDIATGRMLGELVDSLWRTGWLTASSTIGAFSYDDAGARSLVEGALTQALARHGLEIKEYQRVSNSSEGVSQSSAAVLRYKAAGVDRIIPVNANPLFVMQAASNQDYRPRYAMYSLFGPGALMESLAPKDQLQGAAGIGWSPYLDIGRGKKPGPVSANETRCFNVMREGGQSSSSATTKAIQLQLCNAFFYLAYAADKVGSAPADLFAQARSRVGASFPPADTFRIDVSRRVDGVAAYRQLTYVSSCSCFQYGDLRNTK